MTRFDDWQTRLTGYLRHVSQVPFEYGKHDCFIFVGECVRQMTGDKYIDDFKYSDLDEGTQIVRDMGFKNHLHFIASKFPQRKSPLHAQRGDIVLSKPLPQGRALGICQGTLAYGVGQDGLMTFPMSKVGKAFKV